MQLSIARGTSASSKGRKPKFVSPSTTHAALYINGVLSSRQACSNSAACTFAWTANSGSQTFAAEVDDGTNVLAEGAATYTLSAGNNGALAPLDVNGVAAQIGDFSNPETPTGTNTLSGTFAIADADGNAITNAGGSSVFDNGSPTFTSSNATVGTVTIAPNLTPDALGTDYAYSVACNSGQTGTFSIVSGQTGTFSIVGTTGTPSGAVSTANLTANGNLTYPPAKMGGTAYTYTCANGVISDASGTVTINASLPNVYVADSGNSAVKEILAAGGYTTVNTLATGFKTPTGVAVDRYGNVFVADEGNNAVKEIIAAGGYTTVKTLGSGFFGPFGVAVDMSGNVYVADTDNNAVKEILAAGGYTTVNTLGSGFSEPRGVAVDASGNVYVADYGNGAVKEILAAGGYTTVNTLGSGFNAPYGVAVDTSGNVYVADPDNSAVKEILAAGGYTTVNTLGSGLSDPLGVAVDSFGNVYVADTDNSAVKEILAAGGYTTVNTLGSGFSAPQGVAVH